MSFTVTTIKGTDIVKADMVDVKDGILEFQKETKSSSLRFGNYKVVASYNMKHVIKWVER